MRAIVIYESMFGNTRMIAEAIGEGLKPTYDVDVRPAGTVSREELTQVDLIVAGGPTHAWGMSRPSTRAGALKQVEVPGSGLRLETGATGPGEPEDRPAARAERLQPGGPPGELPGERQAGDAGPG